MDPARPREGGQRDGGLTPLGGPRFDPGAGPPGHLAGVSAMPDMVSYRVYVDPGMVPLIEQLCDEHDLSQSAAFREAMRQKLQREGIAE